MLLIQQCLLRRQKLQALVHRWAEQDIAKLRNGQTSQLFLKKRIHACICTGDQCGRGPCFGPHGRVRENGHGQAVCYNRGAGSGINQMVNVAAPVLPGSKIDA